MNNHWIFRTGIDRRHFFASDNSPFIIRMMTCGYRDYTSYVVYDTRKYSAKDYLQYRIHKYGNFHDYSVASKEFNELHKAKNKVRRLMNLELQ